MKRYLVCYTDAQNKVHSKEFTDEKEAIDAYNQLHKLQKKYSLTNISLNDGMCFYYNGYWD